MPITPEQRERLDRLMNDRRLELGLTWRDVASRAALSYEALRKLRSGPGGIRDLTAAQVSRGLSWETRSVGDVLAGGDPRPLAAGDEPPRIPRDAPVCTFEESILGEGDSIAEETKIQLIRVHREGGHVNCRPLSAGEAGGALARLEA